MEEKNETKDWKKAGKAALILITAAVAVLAVRRIFFVKKAVEITPLSTVTAARPAVGDLKIETSLVGTGMPGDIYYAIPMTTGKVTKIYVRTGDTVKKGDRICDIDNQKQIDAAKLTMDSAELQIRTVQDSIALAKTNLDRMEELYKTGDISAQNYEQVKSAYDQAVAGLDGAKLQYDGAKLQYDTQVEFATVTAPADGVIETTDMTVDVYATQSSPVAIISGTGRAKVNFNVTDRLLSALRPGDEIRLEKQGSTYTGTISKVSQMPGQTTGLYAVEAELEDGAAIPTGASVKVWFVSEKAEDALLVPTGAVYFDGGHTYLYTVEYDPAKKTEASSAVMDGNRAATVHRLEVVTGLSDAENTQILSGIGAGDEVIITWTAQLYEGARVQVRGGSVQ